MSVLINDGDMKIMMPLHALAILYSCKTCTYSYSLTPYCILAVQYSIFDIAYSHTGPWSLRSAGSAR